MNPNDHEAGSLAGGSSDRPRTILETLSDQVGRPMGIRLRAAETVLEPSGASGSPEASAAQVERVVTRASGGVLASPLELVGVGPHGKYTLLGEIGHGGVGVVMLGRDGDLGREVAIKVLKEHFATDPWVLQRFIEEAQIGGQLQHPGIVPVYDMGMKDGRPFFSMKIVKGRTFESMLAERGDATAERRRMLGVFEQICQTIAYAHARGVIHRDLKPANVMVGAFGEVQVVDWGLGKVLSSESESAPSRSSAISTDLEHVSTLRSQTDPDLSRSIAGSVMGTPAYMPPEQARGETGSLDERADVFALGAILCEVLTGSPPYLARGVTELVSMAATCDLAACFERLAECSADRDLVELARDCLAAQRDARPRNAEVVSERVGTYLASVEERARRAELEAAEQRVRALAERRARRLTAGLASSILALVALGAGGWIWLDAQRRDRVARLEHSVRSALSESELRSSQGNYAEALSAARRARDLVTGAEDPPAALVRTVEDHAERMASAAAEASARVALELSNRALLDQLEDVRQPEGNQLYSKDWAAVDAAYGAIFAAHGITPDTGDIAGAAAVIEGRGIASQITAALDEWSIVRGRAEDVDGAARLRAIAMAADRSDATRRELREAILGHDGERLLAFAARDSNANLPAATWNLLGRALESVDRERAIEVLEAGQALYPDDFILCMSLARQLSRCRPQRSEQAARMYSAAIALRPNSVEARHELALNFESNFRDMRQAEALMRATLRLAPDDAHLHFHLGNELLEQHRYAEARQAFDVALGLDPDHTESWLNLGLAHLRAGDDASAENPLRRALALSDGHPLVLANLGLILARRGERAEATVLADRLQGILEGSRNVLDWCNLASVFDELDEDQAAERAYRRALELGPDRSEAHTGLGMFLLKIRRHEDALVEFERAVELDPRNVSALDGLGISLSTQRRSAEAAECYRTILQIEPGNARAHAGLGSALLESGDADAGVASLRTAVRLEVKHARAYDELGVALMARGELDEAIATLRIGASFDPPFPPAHWHLGQAFARLQDFASAAEQFRLCTVYFPTEAGAYANLGDALARNEDFDAAITAYGRAVELKPSLAETWCDLGRALARKGRDREALEALVRGHELGASRPGWNRPSASWIAEVRARLDRAGAEANAGKDPDKRPRER